MPLWLTSAQPLHAVPNLYGSGKGWCMVAGHRTADCPVNATYDGLYWPRESVHLEETRWCSTEKAAIWEEADGDLKPVWVDQKFQGTCCHYPATAEVWEARYVKVNVYDEDNWNSNDLLGSFEVDLHELSAASHFATTDRDYDVIELDVKGRPTRSLFTVKVRVTWEHPVEHAISTVWDTKPLKWDPYGVSVSAANAPWEVHGFSPPPPFHCDCSWTAAFACPDQPEGSSGVAKPDGSQCFEYCCPREIFGELHAEPPAGVTTRNAAAAALVAVPTLLLLAFVAHKAVARRAREIAKEPAGPPAAAML